jgi:hypothetical protein
LEYSNNPKAFFTLHHARRCCTDIITVHCCILRHSHTNVTVASQAILALNSPKPFSATVVFIPPHNFFRLPCCHYRLQETEKCHF